MPVPTPDSSDVRLHPLFSQACSLFAFPPERRNPCPRRPARSPPSSSPGSWAPNEGGLPSMRHSDRIDRMCDGRERSSHGRLSEEQRRSKRRAEKAESGSSEGVGRAEAKRLGEGKRAGSGMVHQLPVPIGQLACRFGPPMDPTRGPPSRNESAYRPPRRLRSLEGAQWSLAIAHRCRNPRLQMTF